MVKKFRHTYREAHVQKEGDTQGTSRETEKEEQNRIEKGEEFEHRHDVEAEASAFQRPGEKKMEINA